MAGNAIVANDTLTNIADAINTKAGTSGQMTVQEMAQKIMEIQTGIIPPSSANTTIVVKGEFPSDFLAGNYNGFNEETYVFNGITTPIYIYAPNATKLCGMDTCGFNYSDITWHIPNVTTLGKFGLYYSNVLPSVINDSVFPNITRIDSYACLGDVNGLTKIDKSSISSIGTYAFDWDIETWYSSSGDYYYSSLSEINLSSVTNIPQFFLGRNVCVTKVAFNGATSIAENAFSMSEAEIWGLAGEFNMYEVRLNSMTASGIATGAFNGGFCSTTHQGCQTCDIYLPLVTRTEAENNYQRWGLTGWDNYDPSTPCIVIHCANNETVEIYSPEV